MLVINKSPGLLSIPDGYHPELPHLRSVLEPQFGRLWMVHRLDKDTSGVIVFARNAKAHQSLSHSFHHREVHKVYHGLVSPVPDWREKEISLHLEIDADRKHRTRVSTTSGKAALSICKVLKVFLLGILLEVIILTGITHQIRAHLRAYNLCLLGETLYNAGLPTRSIKAERIMLHARTLTLPHPSTSKEVQFTAPYLDDFRQTYTRLRTTKDPDVMI